MGPGFNVQPDKVVFYLFSNLQPHVTQKNYFSIHTGGAPAGCYHSVDRRKIGLSDDILQNIKRNGRWWDPGCEYRITWGKQIMIRVLSIQFRFPPPVCILREPEPQHLAAAHVIRLLHLHRHSITSFPVRSCLKIVFFGFPPMAD